jgi:MutS domain V/MutS domain III
MFQRIEDARGISLQVDTPLSTHQHRLAQARALAAELDRQGARIANLRTLFFFGGAAILLTVAFNQLPRFALWGVLACAVAFVISVVKHSAVLRNEALAKVFVSLNERALARLADQWHSFSSLGTQHCPEGHLFAADLDVVGQGSLFQLLDETGTQLGERLLAQWLLTPSASTSDIVTRQQAVAELAPLIDFRHALVAEARLVSKTKADPTAFIAWAESSPSLERIRWAYAVAHVLPPVTVTLGLLSAFDVVPNWPFALLFAVQIAVVLATRTRVATFYQALLLGDDALMRFEQTFASIDNVKFVHPHLEQLQHGLQSKGPVVSVRLKNFGALLNFAALRLSPQLHPFVNALLLWDLHTFFRIEAWRRREGPNVRSWFEALAQFEALSAFATFRYERPEFVFPAFEAGTARFEAKNLKHPLLHKAVGNDVTLSDTSRALIITGSNMSGKTTLMRAIGLNAVMAQAGLPICAGALTMSPMRVLTSMRVKDSLERGVSYFYAEVQRTKALLDASEQHRGATLFLIDEMFMGTNTKERQIASKQVVRTLLKAGAIGALTTHDLAMCELTQEPQLFAHNVHFRDSIVDGEMHFDYRLREGIVESTNALEVLRRAGVAV